MAKYRKKPVVIEAFQWTGDENQTEDPKWIVGAIENEDVFINFEKTGQNIVPVLKVKTLEGIMTANQGDYIIQGVQGEIYPCKPDIFEKTYESVE